MTVFPLARLVGSFLLWLMDGEKNLSDFRRTRGKIKGLVITENLTMKSVEGLVITCHVYYEQFADELLDALAQFPKDTIVLLTTPHQELAAGLKAQLTDLGLKNTIKVTPNVGRNFGPLFVEFSRELMKYDSFIHVHSKKSVHSPKFADKWLKRNSDLLLSQRGIERVYQILINKPSIGLVYSDASDLLRGINFRWGRSKSAGSLFFQNREGFEKIKWSGRLSFPAGGMFWVRTESIRPLLEIDWKYEMFPAELGQGDGTLQHAIERMLGALSRSRGFEHGIYFPIEDRFSSEPHSEAN